MTLCDVVARQVVFEKHIAMNQINVTYVLGYEFTLEEPDRITGNMVALKLKIDQIMDKSSAVIEANLVYKRSEIRELIVRKQAIQMFIT